MQPCYGVGGLDFYLAVFGGFAAALAVLLEGKFSCLAFGFGGNIVRVFTACVILRFANSAYEQN